MTSPEAVPLIPRRELLGNPDRAAPRLSPDGNRLAYVAPVADVLNVWVGTVGSDDFKPVTRDTDRGIRNYGFAWDNRHLFYIQDEGGDENWRLYDVDLETGEERDLTPFDGVQVRLIGNNRRRPGELVLGINRANRQLHDVYKLDLASGELDQVESNPGFAGWLIDAENRVRGAARSRPDGGTDLLVRPADGGDWQLVAEYPLEETGGPVGFSLDGRTLLLTTSVDANAARLVRLDLDSGERTVIAEDPEYDLIGVTRNPDTRDVEMVAFRKERIERVILDDSIRPDMEALTELAGPDADVSIGDRDRADRTWIAVVSRDDAPGRFYLWSRDTQKATFLFDTRAELVGHTLARMEPFSFTARDGLVVHGYLSFPPRSGREQLPTVLHVHGGPWSRDVWGFNPNAQWFANRGYLCMQVNYRGSTGYGKAFRNAGDREWAAAMHSDLVDAVEWGIAEGIVDRERVAIHGGSYGGYAALVGATFTPDLFRCAVDVCGPSNLITTIKSFPPYWQPTIARWHARVGNPDTEADFLWSRSPLSRVDDIKVPLLIGQGANDPRVVRNEAEQIVAALEAKGIPYEYVLVDDEGHGFAKPENRLRFAAITERFLAEHLGGRYEPED